ncbi:MAG: sterol desaturase family protein, partial [Bacteroidota bacterium]
MNLDAIINYFSEMPSAHRSAVLIGGLTIFFLIENAAPLFTWKYNKTGQIATNIFLTVTTVIVNFFMAFILVFTSEWVVANQFGIIQWLALPLWAQLVFGLLLLDLISAWLAHYVEHHVKWMWQFHLIHHSDQHVNTTTANRHHPGESVIRFTFTCMGVLIVGAPMWLIFLYQSLSVALSQFNHSNVSMPKWLDYALVTVICTPNMHRVHHHFRQPYSDSNYGNIFSFWDRMFGTYQYVDNKKLVYGVDTYMDPKEASDLMSLLKI